MDREVNKKTIDVSLTSIIRHFMATGLIEDDWEILAVDANKDVVVFKRYEHIKLGKVEQ